MKPPAHAPADIEASSGRALVSARRPRLLVVDDEPLLGIALRRLLSIDFEVTVVCSGAAALDTFSVEHPFDVVLCDVMMPELSGPDLYLVTKERHPPLIERFIFMTGGVFTPHVRGFFASIPNPVLEKPFSLGAVRDAIDDFIERRAS